MVLGLYVGVLLVVSFEEGPRWGKIIIVGLVSEGGFLASICD